MHHEILRDVLEYIAAAAIAVAVVVMLSGQFSMPLWGGLADIHLR